MTPIDMMNDFNRRYSNLGIKDDYKAMQKNYIDGKVKKGLFCDRVFVRDLREVTTDSILEVHKPALQKAFSRINNLEGVSESAKYEQKITEASRIETKGRAERNLGTLLFGTWRNSLGHYRLDDDIADQALASLIPSDTPTSIYTKLPEWCVYVEIPSSCDLEVTVLMEDKSEKDVKVIGFWAMHDKTDKDLNNADSNSDENMRLNVFLHLDTTEAYVRDNYLGTMLILPLSNSLTVHDAVKDYYYDQDEDEQGALVANFSVILSLLLWLCVEEPDITNMEGIALSRQELMEPKYKRSKRADVFIPPKEATYYDIGKRLGSEMREYKAQLHTDSAQRTGKKIRPHVRKGHWHGVWSGTGENKIFSTYWQPATFVNAN